MADEEYDFEDNTLQGWAATVDTGWTGEVNATAALNSTSYGVELSVASDSSNDAYISKTLASTYSDIYLQFRLKIISGSSMQFNNNYCTLAGFAESSIFNVGTNGKVRLLYNSGWFITNTSIDTTFALSEDTEYLIEIRYLRDGSAGGLQIWVDGSLEIDDLDANTSGNNIGFIQVALDPALGGVVANSGIYIDEIKIDSSYIGVAASGISIPVVMHHLRQLFTQIVFSLNVLLSITLYLKLRYYKQKLLFYNDPDNIRALLELEEFLS